MLSPPARAPLCRIFTFSLPWLLFHRIHHWVPHFHLRKPSTFSQRLSKQWNCKIFPEIMSVNLNLISLIQFILCVEKNPDNKVS